MENNKADTTKEHLPEKAIHEIGHGKKLSSMDVEKVWGWESPAGRNRAKRRAELIISGSEIKPDFRILEIGCGTGIFTEYFSKTNTLILAVDISHELISKAKKRVTPNERVSFLCQRFEDVEIDLPFDAVIGSSVLHHLELDEAILNIRRLLKPGAKFVFAEPNMLNPQVFAERTFLRNKLDYMSPDETAFIRWKLKKTLKKHGFIDVRITPFDWLHPATPKVLISPVSGAGRVFEKIPGIKEFSGSLLIEGRKPISG